MHMYIYVDLGIYMQPFVYLSACTCVLFIDMYVCAYTTVYTLYNHNSRLWGFSFSCLI